MKLSAFCWILPLMLVSSLLGACASAYAEERSVAPGTERMLASGRIVGFEDSLENRSASRQKTYGWVGIPYAAPPVGALRWKAPQPPAPWSGTLEATTLGNVCPQLGNRLSGTGVQNPNRITGDEDCLTLNVWTPRFDTVPTGADRLPVMVWIHGGGNSIGTANTYDEGRNLAGDKKVVFVALNYRLGVLGWFRHQALDDATSTPEDRSGNYGTLDQIHALKWVRDNIAAFGGDPNNVTVFGESAGGINIYALLLSPLAKGLFHKAIIQSGLPTTTSIAQATHFTTDAEKGDALSSSEVLARLLEQEGRAPDVAAARKQIEGMSATDIHRTLRGKTALELLSLFKGAGLGMYHAPQLIRDGVVLPLEPPQTLLADPSRYNVVPTLMGTNRDEMKLFLAFNPSLVRWRLGFLPKVKDPDTYNRTASYLSDVWKVGGVDHPASLMSQRGQPPVFAYRFDWDEEPAGRWVNFQQLFGAAHGLEVAFVFHDLERSMNFFNLWNDDNEAGTTALSGAMASYWTHFAYTGAPGRGRAGDLPEWQAWTAPDPAAQRLMVLDTPAGGGIRMEPTQLTLDALKQRLATDPAFAQDPESRCTLYVQMFAGLGRRVGWWDPEEYRTFGPTGCAAYPAERIQKGL